MLKDVSMGVRCLRWHPLAMRVATHYAVVMAPKRLGTLLLCMGALNVLIGTILAVQIPPARLGASAYVFVFCGLILMFAGHYTGKRKA